MKEKLLCVHILKELDLSRQLQGRFGFWYMKSLNLSVGQTVAEHILRVQLMFCLCSSTL